MEFLTQFCSLVTAGGDGPDDGSVRRLLPVRVRHLEQEAHHSGGPVFYFHLRSHERPTGHHLERWDWLGVIWSHSLLQGKFKTKKQFIILIELNFKGKPWIFEGKQVICTGSNKNSLNSVGYGPWFCIFIL